MTIHVTKINNGHGEQTEIVTETLNGSPLIATFMIRPTLSNGKRATRIVIADRGPSLGLRNRYVVAIHCLGDDNWLSGAYRDTLKVAFEEFQATIKLYLPEAIRCQ